MYQQLRAWRRETADAAGVSAFVVANDKLLKRIAAIRPRNEDELMRVKGTQEAGTIRPRNLGSGGEVF